jgi:hypothetical protein
MTTLRNSGAKYSVVTAIAKSMPMTRTTALKNATPDRDVEVLLPLALPDIDHPSMDLALNIEKLDDEK